MTLEAPDIILTIVKTLLFVLLYFIIGIGPGFILGVLLANRLFGKNNPFRTQTHEEAIGQAAEHNQQWHPDNPRWQK